MPESDYGRQFKIFPFGVVVLILAYWTGMLLGMKEARLVLWNAVPSLLLVILTWPIYWLVLKTYVNYFEQLPFEARVNPVQYARAVAFTCRATFGRFIQEHATYRKWYYIAIASIAVDFICSCLWFAGSHK
jgi:hypothetical protein